VLLGFVFFVEVTSVKVHSYWLHEDQSQLLDRICSQLRCSHSFLFVSS